MHSITNTELSSHEGTRCQFNSGRCAIKMGIDVHQDFHVVVEQVGNEVVTEQQPVPMLSERATASDHVYVVSTHAALVAPKEEGVPRWNVIAECGPPEVIIALCLKNWRNLKAGGADRVSFLEQVYDWLGGKSWDSRAAEVLDTANEPGMQEGR